MSDSEAQTVLGGRVCRAPLNRFGWALKASSSSEGFIQGGLSGLEPRLDEAAVHAAGVGRYRIGALRRSTGVFWIRTGRGPVYFKVLTGIARERETSPSTTLTRSHRPRSARNSHIRYSPHSKDRSAGQFSRWGPPTGIARERETSPDNPPA